MTAARSRTRAQYVELLEAKLDGTANEAVRLALEAALQSASMYERSISPLASLCRVVEACDAIESGDAATLANEIGQFQGILRTTRTPINASTVDAYIRLRAAHDARKRKQTEWTGPRRESLSSSRAPLLASYLAARRDAIDAKRPVAGGSRARRVEEIVGCLSTPEDRQDLRFTLDKGYVAQRELALLKRAIQKNFPAVRLADLLNQQSPSQAATSDQSGKVSPEQRSSLARLRNKIKDNDALRHFGLTTDGVRLKTLHTGAHLLEKSEYEALLAVLDRALAS